MGSQKASLMAALAPAQLSDVLYAVRAGGIFGKLTIADILALSQAWNGVRNPGFRIAQRGAVGAIVNAVTYFLDGWGTIQLGAANAASISRAGSIQADFGDSAFVSRTDGSNLVGAIFLGQVLESADSVRYAGKQCTFSFTALKGASYSAAGNQLQVQFNTGTGTDQTLSTMMLSGFTGSTSPVNTQAVLAGAATRYSYTFNVPANATQVGWQFVFTPTGVAGAQDGFFITDVRLHEGASAMIPIRRPLELELAICRRQLEIWNHGGGGNHLFVGGGRAASGTDGRIYVPFKVQKRAIPTLISSAAAGFLVQDGSGNNAVSALGMTATLEACEIAATTSGLATGDAINLLNTNAGSFIGWSAEL